MKYMQLLNVRCVFFGNSVDNRKFLGYNILYNGEDKDLGPCLSVGYTVQMCS